MRRWIASVTSLCVACVQTPVRGGPHEEGVAAGRAANPTVRSQITQPQAASVVPGYTSTPPEAALYGRPNLAGQANARLADCAARPTDPVCQAQHTAVTSANTPRPPVSPYDADVAAARRIGANPSSVLGGLGTYYSGCTTTDVSMPATTQDRVCQRYVGVGNLTCSNTLTVAIDRATNCTPGDWFAHAELGSTGLDAQCRVDEPPTAQHFRVTQNGVPLAFFDVDMTAPIAAPRLAAVLGVVPSSSGRLITSGVWITNATCEATRCTLSAVVAPDIVESCTGGGESLSCISAPTFIQTLAPCPAGTQQGDYLQTVVCTGDSCTSSGSLDGTRCYAPDAAGPYFGTDITGTFPGTTWQLASTRAVTGWSTNPAAAALPTLALSYARPATTATQTDRLDDKCPALAAGGRCAEVSAPRCVDGPSTKVIDGVAVTRDCWQTERTLSCGAEALDQCAPLAATGCTAIASSCRQTNPASGTCERFEDTYRCAVPAQTVTTASNCPSNWFCLGTSCFDIAHAGDPDFARSMSMLEAARESGVYLDTDRLQVFRGEADRCRDRLLKNCCYSDGAGAAMTNQSFFGVGSRLVYDVLMNAEDRQFVLQGMSALLTSAGFSGSFTTYGVTVTINGAALPAGSAVLYSGDSVVVAFDPWALAISVVLYVALTMASCNQEEGRLAMKQGAGLCREVGTWCSACIRVLGVCVSCTEHTTSKCCFNSKLSRIVNEQGRTQIGKGWGNAQNPDCSGFTVPELQRLDFSAMDLSEFYASLVPTLPNPAALQTNNAARAPACYYGQGKC
jgi:conjugal transfer mating pair stabilization protein TraN